MATTTDSDSSLEAEEILLSVLLLRRKRRRLRAASRQIWCKPFLLRRSRQGTFHNLVQELNAEDPEQFRRYHRLDRDSFERVLNMIEPLITKEDTFMRTSIRPRERLSITLRFLATGICVFISHSKRFRIVLNR